MEVNLINEERVGDKGTHQRGEVGDKGGTYQRGEGGR